MKFILIVFCIIITTSCKKSYVCECTTSYTFLLTNGGTATNKFDADEKAYDKKLTKSKAETACIHQRNQIEASFTEAITNNGANPLQKGEKVSTECSIK